MSQERPLSANARAWMDDGPTQLPDRVIDAVLDEVHLTHQRRGVSVAGRRIIPMRINAWAGAAAVIVAAMIGLGAIAILRQPSSVGTAVPPAATATPSTAPAPSSSPSPVAIASSGASPSHSTAPSPSPVATRADGVAPFGAGPMAAGTYASSVFAPAVTLTLPAGWTKRVDDSELLWLSNGSTDLAFHFMAAGASADDLAKVVGFGKGASELPEPPKAVTLGTVTGYSAISPRTGTGIETIFFKPGLNPYDMARGTRLKEWVLDAGRPVTVSLVAPDSEFDAAVSQTDAILATLKLGGG